MKLKTTSSPHIRGKRTTRTLMTDVMIGLVPPLIMGMVFQGVRALAVVLVCVISCMAGEWVFRKLTHQKNTLRDASAAVTGMLLGMCLPVTAPYWMAALGGIFASVVVKGFPGGLGKNRFNPALGARAMLMLAFPVFMVRFAAVGEMPSLLSGADAVTSATPLHEMRIPAIPHESLWEMFLGRRGGCIGEVSALGILLGGGYLAARRVISLRIPLAYLGTVALLALIFSETERPFLWMMYHLLSGGLMLGAFFMATDYVTSPVTKAGKIFYGMGCGVLTYFFRNVGIYPESVTYAILLMNPAARVLDRLTAPRVFGTAKGGKE